MRVLLINPPGSRPYLRDYHCSKVSKAGYLYHPVDLTFQSGILSARHEVRVEDAIAERHSIDDVLRRVKRYAPGAVFCLLGAAAWQEDAHFVAKLRQFFPGKIVVTGDIFLENPEEPLAQLPGVDGVLLDFTSNGFLDYLENPGDAPADMLVADGGKLKSAPKLPRKGSFSIPVPRYDLFPGEKYHYPFVRRRPFATILTDYGCPFPCSYCIMSAVGYRTRPVDNVMEELRWLKRNGYRELYINDQTFGSQRGRTYELLDTMARELLNLGWVCFTRADLLDDELAGRMKVAGCHTVMFGVEHASEPILRSYNKSVDASSVSRAFSVARRYRLRTVATFIIGFPEDDAETIMKTIDIALELDPDFASFNFVVPRRGTGVRKRAIEMGLADPKQIAMDQAGENIAMPTRHLSRDEMAVLRRRAIRSFYLRPQYIIKRALALRTGYEVRATAREGIEVVRGLLRR